MNWVTTNIRLPEDLYMDLKLEAARRRTSMAVVMREKITATKTPQKNDVKKIMASLEKLAKENAKYMKNINLTQALIDMRYEQ